MRLPKIIPIARIICLMLGFIPSSLFSLEVSSPHIPSQKEFNSPWYTSTETGYAWSFKTNSQQTKFHASEKLGEALFLTLAIGKRWLTWLSLDLSYTYYQTFRFERQIATQDPSTTQRYSFSVEVQNSLLNASFDPSEHISPTIGALQFIPIFGAGLGIGLHRTANAHEFEFSDSTTNILVAWQTFFAFRMRPQKAHFSFDVGYRYTAFSPFKIPSHQIIEVSKESLQINAVYLSYNAEW